MSHFTSVIIGNESLAIQCGELLLEKAHTIRAVVTRNADVRRWALGHDLPVLDSGAGLADRLNTQLAGEPFDWLLSIANLDIISRAVLDMPDRGALNFHDGPLPAYAGLNAPVWAALAGEAEHGISWHMIGGGVDDGDVIASAGFAITDTDTALTLNTKCYAAAIDSFPAVITELEKPEPVRQPQDLAQRSYFARNDRPVGGARLDFTRPAADLARMVRALDHGDYWNPLAIAKFEAGGRVWLAREAHVATGASGAAPGAVLAVDADLLSVATGAGDLVLTRITECDGRAVTPQDITRVGAILPCPAASDLDDLTAALAPLASADPAWRATLEDISPPSLPLIGTSEDRGQPIARPIAVPQGLTPSQTRTAFALLGARLSGTGRVDMALHVPSGPGRAAAYMAQWVPVSVHQQDSFTAMAAALDERIEAARTRGSFAADLIARLPGTERPALPALGLSEDTEAGLVGPSTLTLALGSGGCDTFCRHGAGQRCCARSLCRAAQSSAGSSCGL